MKKTLIRLISIFLLTFLFVNYGSTQTASKSGNNDSETIYLIKWKNDYYYVKGKQEIQKVLNQFPKKRENPFKSLEYVLLSFNTDAYAATDTIYFINNKKLITSKSESVYFEINRKDHNYRNNKGTIYKLPDESEVNKIFSELNKAVRKEIKSTNHKEIRDLIPKLLEEEKVLCVENIAMLNDIDVYYKIYVPASSKEEMTSPRISDISDEIGLSGKSAIDLMPVIYHPETQEAELTVHGTIEDYNKIKKYRKSEYQEASYELTLRYYEKL